LRETFSTPPPNTAHHEPDEITAVTARSRPIRIPVERQKTSKATVAAAFLRSSVDNLFSPALFSGSTATAANERSSMFSGFYGESADRGSLVPRVIKIGGLVVAIASLVLIGKQFTGELRSEAAPVTTNSTRSVSASTQQPVAEVQNEPQRISETTFVNPPSAARKSTNEPTSVKTSTDQPPKSRSTFSEDKPSSAVEKTRSKSDPKSLISKPTKADTAKTSSRSQPLARAAKADPKPQSLTRNTNKPIAQNKPGATTRPRIVANPRP
jgi:hypothetical protein